MPNNIGKLAVMIVANANGVKSGVGAAIRYLQGFAGAAAKAGAAATAGLSRALTLSGAKGLFGVLTKDLSAGLAMLTRSPLVGIGAGMFVDGLRDVIRASWMAAGGFGAIFQGLAGIMGGSLAGIAGTLWAILAPLARGGITLLGSTLAMAGGLLKPPLLAALSTFGSLLESGLQFVWQSASKVMTLGVNLVWGPLTAAGGMITTGWSRLVALFQASGIGTFVGSLATRLTGVWSRAASVIGAGFSYVWGPLTAGGGMIAAGWSMAVRLFQASGIGTFVTGLATQLAGVWQSAGKVIGAGIGKVFGGAKALVGAGGLLLKGVLGATLGVGVVAAGLVGFAPGFFEEMTGKIREFSDVGRKAKGLGVLSEDFMALTNNAKQFGLEGADVERILFKLGAMEAPKLGIGMEEWTEADKIGRLKLVADQIAAMKNANDQSAASFAVLGKQGQGALALFQQGAKGIEEWTAKQKALGLAISQTDMNKLMRVKQALPKFGQLFEGFQTKAMIAVAPVIEQAVTLAQQAMPVVTMFLDVAARGLTRFWEIAAGVGGILVDAILRVGQSVTGMSGGWDSLIDKMPSVEEAVTQAMRVTASVAALAFDAIRAGIGGVVYAWGYLTQKSAEFVPAMARGLAQVSWQVGDYAQTLGLRMEKMGLPGGAAIRQFGTELLGEASKMEKVGDQVAQQMNEMGGAAMKWGEAQINAFGEAGAAVDEFFKNLGKNQTNAGEAAESLASRMMPDYHAAGAFQFGGKEAASVQAKFRFESAFDEQRQDTAKQTLEVTKAHLEATREMARNILRLGDAFGDAALEEI